ncbi:glycine--tRNA ligase subunit beta [Undibacterium sp. Rencai35W]|uniref:glycine--tRNA ligase subunit beta n=1 Tax=Undibacterium sp. Rencai35W TaxID=3413046 RepID=UPI003BEFCBA4
MNNTLLVELFTEELPPKALAKLGEAFAAGIVNGLKARDFLESDSVATSYASPRRLAVSITNVRATSPDKVLREKVLPVSVALDAAGNATAPLAKKLAALGFPDLQVSQLERAVDGKAESFFYSYTAAGSALAGSLQTTLEEAISKLPIPKVMSYQRPDGETVHFVRPVHRIIALHGADIVPLSLLGLKSDRVTLGHRFLTTGQISIAHANDYAANLASQGKVIASVAERKEKIRAALLAKAGNDQVLMPESLLDEVTALVEWPVIYECKFEDEFLAVPQECLILTMQTNQKYFALTDVNGKLRSRFLIVSNLETATPEHIIQGNERVVRPRLSDAKFFFEQDKKKTLEARLPMLANVVYHNKLGSQKERTERVQSLAGKIALSMGTDAALAERGALLAKADLLTDMVGEFPELQGIMGTYYALHDGEHAEVAAAASEHYQPRFAGDALPATATGTAVALADKLETLVGIWGIGLQPTGDRDPFALRRHALGVLRILIEKKLTINLHDLLKITQRQFTGISQFADHSEKKGISVPTYIEVLFFIRERAKGYLKDCGFSTNEIESVVSIDTIQPFEYLPRLKAVKQFQSLPEAKELAEADKRIRNIIFKNGAESMILVPRQNLLIEEAEIELFNQIQILRPLADQFIEAQNFEGALNVLAKIHQPVTAFFKDVMVMAEDNEIRNNRMALLHSVGNLTNQVANISKLAT